MAQAGHGGLTERERNMIQEARGSRTSSRPQEQEEKKKEYERDTKNKNLSRPQVRVGGWLAHINKGGRVGVERG